MAKFNYQPRSAENDASSPPARDTTETAEAASVAVPAMATTTRRAVSDYAAGEAQAFFSDRGLRFDKHLAENIWPHLAEQGFHICEECGQCVIPETGICHSGHVGDKYERVSATRRVLRFDGNRPDGSAPAEQESQRRVVPLDGSPVARTAAGSGVMHVV